MAKKIVALNGSGRKHGNSAKVLDAFLEGAASAGVELELERVDIFDLDYKGCRGCHGCEMKNRKANGCVQRDGASELLTRMRAADGVVFASPVFFWELSAQLRALLERYIYPGPLNHLQEVAAIYTMFQPESVSDQAFEPHAETVRHMIRSFLRYVRFTELRINQTQAWETGKTDAFDYGEAHVKQVEAIHAARWEGDLAKARQAGEDFARRIAAR